MLIETTIHIKTESLRRLATAATMAGVSRCIMISALLRRYANDNTRNSVQWSRVRYQERNSGESWQRLHLTLNPDEYEFFLDLRKVFKKSVSACAAEAIDLYLDDLQLEMKKNVDNYRYKNYSFTRIIIDDIVCWILSWGVPRRPLTQLVLE
jgi:hypothetical protein